MTVCIEGEEREFETVTTNARRELGQYPNSRTRQRDDEGVRSMVGQASEDQDGGTATVCRNQAMVTDGLASRRDRSCSTAFRMEQGLLEMPIFPK